MGRNKEVLIEKGKSGMEEGKEKTEGGGGGGEVNTEGKSEGGWRTDHDTLDMWYDDLIAIYIVGPNIVV